MWPLIGDASSEGLGGGKCVVCVVHTYNITQLLEVEYAIWKHAIINCLYKNNLWDRGNLDQLAS